MEIITNEIQDLVPVVITNYEELKKDLIEKTNIYKNIVYSEENIKDAKTDRANLNKLEKAINEEKIRVKNIFLKPYEDFENKCKELMALVKEASTNIDTQVKAFEQKQDAEKRELIRGRYDNLIGKYKDIIKFEAIFNPKWLNKTYTYSKIEEDIIHLVNKANTELETIESQIQDEDLLQRIKDFYFQHFAEEDVLAKALYEKNRIIENQEKMQRLQEETKKIVENLDTTPAEIYTITFKVHATKEQVLKLKAFLETNNIEFERG